MIILNDWWASMMGIEKIFWGISIVFSVLFVIQFGLSLIGLDMDADADADLGDSNAPDSLDSDFSMLSVRSVIAFFTFFGWTGVLALKGGMTTIPSLGIATVAGLIAMFIVSYLFYLFMKLQDDGRKFDAGSALFTTGEVYLLIPEKGKGLGKVQLKLQGVVTELDAISDGAKIKTGSKVKVIDVVEDKILVVEPLEQNYLPLD